MKLTPTKVDVGITTLNLGFWLWAVAHMKQHGDHLGGPHLIALVALMVSVLIWFRAVLADRCAARSIAEDKRGAAFDPSIQR